MSEPLDQKEKVKNIFAFLSIIFWEKWECLREIMDMNPDYLIEKFERYVLSTKPESDWGLHTLLRREVFDRYCEKHSLPITEGESTPFIARSMPSVIEERIDELETCYQGLSAENKFFMEQRDIVIDRLKKLEEHHKKQIDENGKTSRRVDKLEKKFTPASNQYGLGQLSAYDYCKVCGRPVGFQRIVGSSGEYCSIECYNKVVF